MKWKECPTDGAWLLASWTETQLAGAMIVSNPRHWISTALEVGTYLQSQGCKQVAPYRASKHIWDKIAIAKY